MWVLGEGGGKVYMALQRPLMMKAALKLLKVEGSDEATVKMLLAKFESEARALAHLGHPTS